MKNRIIFSVLIFIQCSLWANTEDDQKLCVFATPIEHAKSALIRESSFFNRTEEIPFFQDLGISTYHCWIQNVQDLEILIHLVKGNDLNKSFELLQTKISQEDETALQFVQIYRDALGLDLTQKDFFGDIKELMPLLQLDEAQSFTREYCFIYPILSSKKTILQKMFQERSEYWNEQVQELYRHRGIVTQKCWIQETESVAFLVIYQKIAGQVKEARRKYLDSKTEQFSLQRSLMFSELTGLSYEELLPRLESLFDAEILD